MLRLVGVWNKDDGDIFDGWRRFVIRIRRQLHIISALLPALDHVRTIAQRQFRHLGQGLPFFGRYILQQATVRRFLVARIAADHRRGNEIGGGLVAGDVGNGEV